VQDAEEADRRAEVFGVGGDLEERRGTGAEQEVVEPRGIASAQRVERVRERETTCTDDTSSSSRSRAANQRSRACAWHFGQCRFRHEL
jgi:hypothetical protein